MKDLVRISIATVVYNDQNSIEETIISVINQQYRNIEYIVIDGNSTDGTKDIISKYIDSISIFISEPDKGIYDAINKALSYATGEFIVFLNSGDSFYSLETISTLVTKMDELNSVYYGISIIRESKKIIGRHENYFNSLRLVRENICHQSIFYPKLIYKEYTYNLNYPAYADWIYNISIFNKVKFKYLDLIISNHEIGGFSFNYRDQNFYKDISLIIYRELGIQYWFYYKLRTNVRSIFIFLGIMFLVRNLRNLK